jgi:hypothetical protein
MTGGNVGETVQTHPKVWYAYFSNYMDLSAGVI